MNGGHLWIAIALATLAACRSAPLGVSEGSDPLGKRYRCDDIGSADVCLDLLEDACTLVIARGRGIPAEPESSLVLVEGQEARIVRGPDELAGCVRIATTGEALEYLRFFSSYETVHLFAEQRLEVFRAEGQCFAVCLPSERWRELGLSEARIEETESGFTVTRFVIKPVPSYYQVSMFRVVESVSRDGRVSELSSEPIPIPEEDRLRLGFPRFM